MTSKNNFNFGRRIKDALSKNIDRRIKDALSKKGIEYSSIKPSVLTPLRPFEKIVTILQHCVVGVMVVIAICIFGIGLLKLINIMMPTILPPFLSLPNIEGKIMPLLIILDLCLITITVLVLSKEIDRAFGFKPDIESGNLIPPAFEGGKILGMVVVTTSIVFLTIIISIGQRQEEVGPLGPLGIVDVLYLAASIAIVIISLALFLFVRERKL